MRPLECATPERRAVNLYFRLPIDILVTTETEFGITETFPLLIPLLIRHVRAWGGRETHGRLPEGRWHDGRTRSSQHRTQALCAARHETFTVLHVRAARSSWQRTTRPTTSRSDGRTLAARTQSRSPGERRAVGEQVGGTCRASIRVTHNFNSLRRPL